MTTVRATISVSAGDVDKLMAKLTAAGFDPQIESQRHRSNEVPLHDGVKLVLVNFKNWGNSSWRLVEYFCGSWIFEGYEFENVESDDIEIVCWYDLPEKE